MIRHVLALLFILLLTADAAASWKAGVARVKITPDKPMWMSGYASRDRPAEGTLHDLWAKALALEDGAGNRAVLVSIDVCGIDRGLSNRVRDRLRDAHGLGRESIALCVSHTHTGPVVGDNLKTMYVLAPEQRILVQEYSAALEERLVRIAGEALERLATARLEWGTGTAGFAVNRRNNPEAEASQLRADGKLKGPVDHDLPVLVVRDGEAPNDKLIAVAFGYACHATTLSFYQWSNDWPGFAQIELERAHPGAVALFWAGCGADQNPLPRRTVELAQQYGADAATGVERALTSGSMREVTGELVTRYDEIDLPFATIPAEAQLRADAESADRYVAARARMLLDAMGRGDGKLPASYPYPVQIWRLGPDVTFVLLGGEVVVDYALRLKRELGEGTTWVGAYANDVMAYIPSARVLKEGGYEGGGAMVYYGLPSPWAESVEEGIVEAVRRLATGKE